MNTVLPVSRSMLTRTSTTCIAAWLVKPGHYGSSPAETYLNIEQLIDVARRSEATMVHPGYGFLSERAEFARAVEAAEAYLDWPTPGNHRAIG